MIVQDKAVETPKKSPQQIDFSKHGLDVLEHHFIENTDAWQQYVAEEGKNYSAQKAARQVVENGQGEPDNGYCR